MEGSPNWPQQPVHWSKTDLQFLSSPTSSLENQSLSTIIKNSENFPLKFPIDTGRCKTLKNFVNPDKLESYINSAYPILHEKALILFVHFLIHQRKFGSAIERKLYASIENIPQFVDRLLLKKAAVFIDSSDRYLLKNGTRGAGNWERIGSPNDTEDQEPNLQTNLSYLELKLSALLSISSYSYFVNDGNRFNNGLTETDREKLEEDGVIIGLIGPRFERPLVMEYQDIIISKEQNTPSKGYGNHFIPTIEGMFLNFYEQPNLTYQELQNDLEKNSGKYQKLQDGKYFNNEAYKNRLSISFDTLLIEANDRARFDKKFAFVHVVGIGLGVWAVSKHQKEVFVDTFMERIKSLGRNLNCISDIRFSYIKTGDSIVIPIDSHPLKGIKVHFENVEPHLSLKDPKKLLVVSYAADGNSLPGNEYWWGALSASGDPAAAASTQIAELHTPEINPVVCGANLRIATLDNGLMRFKDYVDRIKDKIQTIN